MAEVMMGEDGAEQEIAPNETVYVRNINEKVKLPVLVETLRGIFGEFGEIQDIIAKKSLKRKGQAFIVYDSIESAQNAIDDLNGFELFDKQLALEFAKTRSDITVRNEDGDEAYEEHKKQRIAERERKEAADAAAAAQSKSNKRTLEDDNAAEPAAKQAKSNANVKIVPDEYLPPNPVLTIRDLPESFTKDEVVAIFGGFPGFKDARLPPGRPLAYVEYVDANSASAAKTATAGATIREHKLRVTFRRG